MNLDRFEPEQDGRSRQPREITSFDAVSGDGRDRVHVLENGIAMSDPVLGREAESHVLELLACEDMAGIEVRIRLCRDEADDVKFICKVDYPGDVEHKGAWRWWSPLLSTPGELRAALQEGLELRRRRNGLPRLETAKSQRKTPRIWPGPSSRSLKRPTVHRRSSSSY